jgi:hypothetical protein
MARWRGTTTERGYGGDHAKLRKQRLAVYQPGQPCTIGGEPLNLPPSMLDLAHDHVNGGYLPGLSCRYHNRQEGAQRGNHGRGFVPAAMGSDVRCKTCGRPYRWAARSCEMCGAHYHPSYGEQRTCGRACGRDLQRRNRMATGWLPRDQRPKPPSKPRVPREPTTWPSARLQHYTCRYCGAPGVTKATGQPREVCPSRECQMARLAANNLRVRNGLSKDEADAQMRVAVTTGYTLPLAPLRPRSHKCPGCGEQTERYRWCDACCCTSANAKGRRCSNPASADGRCDFHAYASSRQW